MAIPVYLGIMAGTATLNALLTFYKNYKTSKSISEDPEEPTTTDDFDGYMCNGYRCSNNNTDPTITRYYYNSVSYNGATWSNLQAPPEDYPYNKNWIKMDYTASDGTTTTQQWYPAGINEIISSVKGFIVSCGSSQSGGFSMYAYAEKSTGVLVRVSGSLPSSGICASHVSVSQSTQASINLETWNANVDWLEDLIDSGSTDGVSIDSDSYTEVTDPDELADTIMDAINDNDYEGTLAEIPEPISYATTVKAALDDLDTKVIDTSPVDVIADIPESESSTGTPGQIAYNSNYIYVCVATDTWKRAALGSW